MDKTSRGTRSKVPPRKASSFTPLPPRAPLPRVSRKISPPRQQKKQTGCLLVHSPPETRHEQHGRCLPLPSRRLAEASSHLCACNVAPSGHGTPEEDESLANAVHPAGNHPRSVSRVSVRGRGDGRNRTWKNGLPSAEDERGAITMSHHDEPS
ncbi:hypothetical protein VTI74DRAFT_5652 [Chaetomium olivicolor]